MSSSSSFLAAPPFDAAVEKVRILKEIGRRQGMASRVSFCETKIRNLSVAATRNIYQIAAIFGWLEHNAPAVVARLRREEEQQYEAMMLSKATSAVKEQEMVKKIEAINRRFGNAFDWNFGAHQPAVWSGEMLDKMRRLAGVAEEKGVMAVEVKRRLSDQVVARLRNPGRHTRRDSVLMTTDILAVTTVITSSAGLAKAPVEDGAEVEVAAASLASAVESSSFVTDAMDQGAPGLELPESSELARSGNSGRLSSATLGGEFEIPGVDGEEEEDAEQLAAATGSKRKAAPEDGFAKGAQGAGEKRMKKGKGRGQPSPQMEEQEIEQGRRANAAPPPPPDGGMRRAMLSLLEGQYLRDQASLEEYTARDLSDSDAELLEFQERARKSKALWQEMMMRMGDGGEYAYFG